MMLWVRDLDSLDAKLLPGTETAAFPFWSPDSRSIGFFTPFRLKVIHAAGGPCRDIADVVLGRGGAWNRDGIIVFCPRPVGALCQIPATGGTPQAVTSLDPARAEISHGFPQFLADGRRFIYDHFYDVRKRLDAQDAHCRDSGTVGRATKRNRRAPTHREFSPPPVKRTSRQNSVARSGYGH
jgi:hypothetical protein